MAVRRGFTIILLFAVITLFTGCNSYQKLLRSNDITLKYRAAEEFFGKNDFQRALPLYEDIYKFYIGTKDAEIVSYHLSYCYYKMGEYTLGAYQFKNFADAYPLSQFAEEASYYYAYCLFLDSPQKDLDQSSTVSAINAFQLFTEKYPQSKHVEECNKNIDILSNKLEEKAVDNALLYYQIENYKAAVWAIRNVVEDYPATKQKEYLENIIVRASYQYAINSVDEKKLERYTATVEYYKEFKDQYPTTKYDIDLKPIIAECNRQISILKSRTNE